MNIRPSTVHTQSFEGFLHKVSRFTAARVHGVISTCFLPQAVADHITKGHNSTMLDMVGLGVYVCVCVCVQGGCKGV